MRLLILLVILCSALWSGYWFVGSSQLEKQITAGFNDAALYGIDASYSDLEVAGFPNRFDTRVEDLEVQDTVTGLKWVAPAFQVFALSYNLKHVIAIWPDTQQVRLGDYTVNISSTDMRGSLITESLRDPVLSSLRFVAQELALQSVPTAAQIGIHHLFIATRQSGTEFSHDVNMSAADIALSDDLKSYLDPEGTQPDLIHGIRVNATVGFDAPIGPQVRARPTEIQVHEASVEWGELRLAFNGTLQIDTWGFLSGTLDLEVDNWRDVADVLARLGILQPGWSEAAQPLVANAADPDRLVTQLSYDGGVAYFGPLPIGVAPRLY